ncbi:phage regulatory protein, Rha family [Campylobacter pinnipediorum subsp. caledonicus]|uniref:Rha family transcriptional regulator n=1 Tax=Campylobacter pinnipediorum TaxID=1965231 RepID=UPI0009955562|nr:Rha family transcriptional regulator [Campylobacter pinnipediorum]AQW85597.1 phage regulatory protein, Rha family [Campylobacter pinnipediorum subsp. caledonicus]
MSSLISINNISVDFKVVGNEIFANSLQIAEVFGKNHRDILSTIRALPNDDFREHNFQSSFYINSQNKKQPCYNLTRDGFSLLVMGFTGEKAYKWKIEFIKAFNMMEAELKAIKTKHYINEISALKAHQILQSKRVTNQINGYKSQIAQHNKQIAILKADLQKIDNTKAILQNVKDERDYFRKKYYEAYKTLGKDKDIVLSLHKIQKHLEPVYTALGAVMAYVDSNNTYFMKNNEIFKT